MNRKVLTGLAAILIAAGALTLVTALAIKRQADHGVAAQNVGSAPDESWKREAWLHDYRLIERSGKTFDSQSLAGHVHVVSFFFASCPGPCFNQNKVLQSLQSQFGDQGVKFVSITCNPEQDTPAVLQEYARKFDARPDQWFFLTGDLLHIRRIGGEIYQVPVDKGTHTEKLLVVDKWGKIRGGFHWNKPAQLSEMRMLFDKLCAETAPPPEPVVESTASAKPPLTDDDDDGLVRAPPAELEAKPETAGQP